MSKLLQVSLRQQTIYIPASKLQSNDTKLNSATAVLTANLAKLGFAISEELSAALNRTTPAFQADMLEWFQKVMGIDKNWTPLVKGWDEPTNETNLDHIMTFYVNIFGANGTEMPCGHVIPENTFPLDRYNGCPFCGTPLEFAEIEYTGQGSTLKVLELWQEQNISEFFKDLLMSKTALDATQVHSLKILLKEWPLPDVEIEMKETLMLIIGILIGMGRIDAVKKHFKTPADILRFLWYRHTGNLQLVKPKTIINRKTKNAKAVYLAKTQKQIEEEMFIAKIESQVKLYLKYKRRDCRMIAGLLNNMQMDVQQMCEIMHPHRDMWVRFIRALRLPEYAKKEGYAHLKELLHVFYNEDYPVWQGKLNAYRQQSDVKSCMQLLKQRPGYFARTLFSHMLWFGMDEPVLAFTEIIDKIPARLLFTLSMYRDIYFNPDGNRTVYPLGGVRKRIEKNKILKLYTKEQLKAMQNAIEDMCLQEMQRRYSLIENTNKTMYVDPLLYYIPVTIGDRGETIQDLPSTIMGSRFQTQGKKIRLFMQWGEGLPAQHLDMDLSCIITYENKSEYCSYSNLAPYGCRHSGDIQHIPDKVGTAEYIDIDIFKLQKKDAKYITFTCNAYSSGSITPGLTVGWMDSSHRMRISEKNGVAYDPSCVQHQINITRGLTKGLVFGVLELATREIIWLEMPFHGQITQNTDQAAVEALLEKLKSKLNIGNLLQLKAEAQGLTLVDDVETADEVYDPEWGLNAAAVTQLLVD